VWAARAARVGRGVAAYMLTGSGAALPESRRTRSPRPAMRHFRSSCSGGLLLLIVTSLSGGSTLTQQAHFGTHRVGGQAQAAAVAAGPQVDAAPPNYVQKDDQSLWASPHRGDVRAVIRVPAALAGTPVQAEIVWRRRDQDPSAKRVLVTDSEDNEIADAHAPVVNLHSGHVVFTPNRGLTNQTYFVYYLPYTSDGFPLITNCAHLHTEFSLHSWNLFLYQSDAELRTLM
jgi:hypothetical protein